MRTRVVVTASGKKALQVVSKIRGKLSIHKHLGTYTTQEGKERLLKQAEHFILKATGQASFLDLATQVRPWDIVITSSHHTFLYDVLATAYDTLGLDNFPDKLVKDLVIARIYQPASKRETVDILTEKFGKKYTVKTIYRHLKRSLSNGVKEAFQDALIRFTKESLQDSLRLIFYDVTTLYFDSGARTGLKDFGFSKDHRPQDTQVVIGLVVNQQGFPLYFDIFSGKTFEGHTFIPIIKQVKNLIGVDNLIVVADAAMISKDNIEKLEDEKIGFIVGARLATIAAGLREIISKQLEKTDGKTVTVDYYGNRLVCQYSDTRAAKDKSERLKQVSKAQVAINTPSQVTRRFRYLKQHNSQLVLNQELITKAEQLEGIKGYLTNTDLDETTVIERYHDLWRIEYSFRITKTDLDARPIYHRLEETIKAHLVIVFAGLAISKYLELNTGISIKQIVKIAGRVLTHKVTNSKTGESAYIETTIDDTAVKEKLDRLKSLGH